MNSTVVQFLDALNPGALWVTGSGLVRHANRAAQDAALTLGGALVDPDLARAVRATVLDSAPRSVDALGLYSAEIGQFLQFRCQVLQDLSGDGAFVIIDAGIEDEAPVRRATDCRQVPLSATSVVGMAHQSELERRHNRRVTGPRRMAEHSPRVVQPQHCPAE